MILYELIFMLVMFCLNAFYHINTNYYQSYILEIMATRRVTLHLKIFHEKFTNSPAICISHWFYQLGNISYKYLFALYKLSSNVVLMFHFITIIQDNMC